MGIIDTRYRDERLVSAHMASDLIGVGRVCLRSAISSGRFIEPDAHTPTGRSKWKVWRVLQWVERAAHSGGS